MENKITLGEDLMREHGLMNRLMLLYKESVCSIGVNEDSIGVLKSAAKIMHDFIHDFHEENEEHDVYPLFNENKKMHTITTIMEEQHEVGKRMTERILSLTKAGVSPDSSAISEMTDIVEQFQHMYMPHASLEDTVLWPAVQEMKGDAAYTKMGMALEKKEEEKFGEEYFDKLASRVEKLEKKLGISDLSVFTAGMTSSPSK